MHYLVNSEEARLYDRNTTDILGIPPLLLMERAAMALSCEIRSRFAKKDFSPKILIFSGTGNNGGDGAALARILSESNDGITICCLGDSSKRSPSLKEQLAFLAGYGITPVPFPDITDLSGFDVIVDCLLGTGCSRDLTGDYLDACRMINDTKKEKGDNILIISADVPTGVDSDNGRICGEAVCADVTVTFAFAKRGLALFPGCEYAGEIVTAPIGITEASFSGKYPGLACLDGDPGGLLPKRQKYGNKGTFGKLLIVAGSPMYSGACMLSAISATRSGAGMVHVFTAEENRLALQTGLPSAILTTYKTGDDGVIIDKEAVLTGLRKAMSWADCLVAGPGMSTSASSSMILREILTSFTGNLVLDADALNLISADESLKKLVKDHSSKQGAGFVIMTPHVAEFARLCGGGMTVQDVKADMISLTKKLADELSCCIICKDARSVIASYDSGLEYLSVSGNDGMARAGSGDILSGITGALSCTGLPAIETAALSAYIHGLAGDAAAAKNGTRGMAVEDMTEELINIMKGKAAC